MERAELTAERIARNDSIFRAANERIRDVAERFEMANGVPFVCECADPACTDVLRLSLDHYRNVRENPRWFATAAGHEEDSRSTEVVARYDGHVIVEKVGRAGEVAEELGH